MNTVTCDRRLDGLKEILERQVSLARVNDLRSMDDALVQCADVIEQLQTENIFQSDRYKSKCQAVMKSYNSLILMLSADKSKISGQLKSLRKNARTLVLYKAGSAIGSYDKDLDTPFRVVNARE